MYYGMEITVVAICSVIEIGNEVVERVSHWKREVLAQPLVKSDHWEVLPKTLYSDKLPWFLSRIFLLLSESLALFFHFVAHLNLGLKHLLQFSSTLSCRNQSGSCILKDTRTRKLKATSYCYNKKRRTVRSRENETDSIGSRIPMQPSTPSLLINCWSRTRRVSHCDWLALPLLFTASPIRISSDCKVSKML